MRPGAGRQMQGRILQRYDKDGDGKLNEEERTAFEKARQQRGWIWQIPLIRMQEQMPSCSMQQQQMIM